MTMKQMQLRKQALEEIELLFSQGATLIEAKEQSSSFKELTPEERVMIEQIFLNELASTEPVEQVFEEMFAGEDPHGNRV